MSKKKKVIPWKFGVVVFNGKTLEIVQLNSIVSLDHTGIESLIAALNGQKGEGL